MKFEEHCKESLILFGDEFREVHLWLDEFAGKPGIGMHHRRLRHHLCGIEEAEKIFGSKGATAARQHIISDLKEEGWSEKDSFPKDEFDYVRMGLF